MSTFDSKRSDWHEKVLSLSVVWKDSVNRSTISFYDLESIALVIEVSILTEIRDCKRSRAFSLFLGKLDWTNHISWKSYFYHDIEATILCEYDQLEQCLPRERIHQGYQAIKLACIKSWLCGCESIATNLTISDATSQQVIPYIKFGAKKTEKHRIRMPTLPTDYLNLHRRFNVQKWWSPFLIRVS